MPDTPPPAGPRRPPGSVDVEEVARFSALAAEWWKPEGKFGILHHFNPVRLAYIHRFVCAQFQRADGDHRPFTGIDLLDIGCGGGLLSEPAARLGACVTGVDASAANIRAAATHAGDMGLDITYRHGTAEDLAAAGARFDVILNMEVIEHTSDPGTFLHNCATMLKPGGIMIIATINRTPVSYLLAIVGAEYVLGWLPRGTHDWCKFVPPQKIIDTLSPLGIQLLEPASGVVYRPLSGTWTLSQNTSVNYMCAFSRSTEKPPVRS